MEFWNSETNPVHGGFVAVIPLRAVIMQIWANADAMVFIVYTGKWDVTLNLLA